MSVSAMAEASLSWVSLRKSSHYNVELVLLLAINPITATPASLQRRVVMGSWSRRVYYGLYTYLLPQAIAAVRSVLSTCM